MYAPSSRHHALDGLRALAVLAVLLGHGAPRIFPNGHLGVDAFFALSGYLITGLLWTTPLSLAAVRAFWKRRFWRLTPALVAVVGASLALSWVVGTPTETGMAFLTGLGAVFGTSHLILPLVGDYFNPDQATNPLLHTWSLGVEAQFYLIFPFLVWGLHARPRLAMAVFGALALASLAHAQALYSEASPWAHYSPFARVWQLLAGAMLAIGVRCYGCTPRLPWSAAALLVLVGTLAAPVGSAGTLWPHVLVVGATVLLIAHTHDRHPLGRLLCARPVQAIGLASYSIYLWHQPVMATVRLFTPDTHLLFFALSLPLIGLFGAASYLLLERRTHTHGRVMAGGLALAIMAIVVTSTMAIGTQGFVGRYAAMPPVEGLDNPRSPSVQACSPVGAPSGTPLCTFPGTNTGASAPAIAVWGDSFALSMIGGFLELPTHPPLVHMAMNGCPLQIDDQWPVFAQGCQAHHHTALKRIIDDPTIATVVIFSRWNVPTAPNGAVRLLASLEKAIDAVHGAGKQVVFVQSTPAYPRAVDGALMRDWRLGTHTLPTQTLEAHLHDPTRLSQQAESLARAKGAVIVPTLDLRCTTSCPSLLDGVAQVHDEEHPTPVSMAPVAARVLAVIPTATP